MTIVESVVDEFAEAVDGLQIMIVGAQCRNMLAERHGHEPPDRETKDIDMAVAVQSWDVFDQLRRQFAPPNAPWQKMEVNGLPIDVVPFGDVENPPGYVIPDGGEFELSVFGYQQVFADATVLHTPAGHEYRLPSVRGLGLMKVNALLERYHNGEYKDAVDLATVVWWYFDDMVPYQDKYFNLLSDKEWTRDPQGIAAVVLGIEIQELLGSDAPRLHRRIYELGEDDRELLYQKFTRSIATPDMVETRFAVFDGLFYGLTRAL